MDYVILILVLIIFFLGMYVWKLRNEKNEAMGEVERIQSEMEEYEDLGKGMIEYNQKLHKRKEQIKREILELIEKNGKIRHGQAAEALKLSHSSTERYFDELEVEGKVKQAGSGKYVYYSLA